MENGKDEPMMFKWFGALFVITACGGIGVKIALSHLYEERSLRQLIGLLDYMTCEIQYKLTPLPELCRQTAAEGDKVLAEVFLRLAKELEEQVRPNVSRCMHAVLAEMDHLPKQTSMSLELLGRSLGRFDLQGQLKGLESVRQTCRRKLEILMKEKDTRLRGYQTLALCAGAALVILFI